MLTSSSLERFLSIRDRCLTWYSS